MEKKQRNKDRFLIEALRLIAARLKIEFSSFSNDWIVRLDRNRVSRFVYGYNFDLNSSAASLIVNDKAALSNVLERNKISHVEHKLFLTPELSEYLGPEGNWFRAMQFVESTGGYPIVCKGNQGTGGNAVFKIQNQKELEDAFQKIHASERGLALSPYYPVEAEYRMIILNGSELLCYEKQQPYVVGDGDSTYYELIQSKFSHDPEMCKAALLESSVPLNEIPDKENKISLIWKHNLSKGAVPLFELDQSIRQSVFELSRAACLATGIRFASVDVVSANGEMKVMEVNAGVMMETVSRFSDEGRRLALDVYTRAVDAMFNEKN